MTNDIINKDLINPVMLVKVLELTGIQNLINNNPCYIEFKVLHEVIGVFRLYNKCWLKSHSIYRFFGGIWPIFVMILNVNITQESHGKTHTLRILFVNTESINSFFDKHLITRCIGYCTDQTTSEFSFHCTVHNSILLKVKLAKPL